MLWFVWNLIHAQKAVNIPKIARQYFEEITVGKVKVFNEVFQLND